MNIQKLIYQIEEDYILLLFKNNNHFNLLINKEFKNKNNIDIEQTYDKLHSDIEKNIKILKKRHSQL